jgi:hypothetical protein
MRRFRLMIGGLLIGALLGALAVWIGPGKVRHRDPLIAGTRQVCEAILEDEATRWESVRRRYFTGEDEKLLKVAKAQALFFPGESQIVNLRRCADGETGDRQMVAVECRARTSSGDRILTLHWERERGKPWRPTDLVSAAVTPTSPVSKSLPAAGKTVATEESKPHPQAH